MIYRPLLIFSTLVWSFTPHLSAQSKTPDSLAHERTLEGVVVTGTQTPRSLKKLPIITQVISRKDLERLNPRSATDALQMSMPGINVTTHGAQSRVTVQGFSGDHILFLVDGERLTSEGNGVVDLSRIDLSSIERIEVVRGVERHRWSHQLHHQASPSPTRIHPQLRLQWRRDKQIQRIGSV